MVHKGARELLSVIVLKFIEIALKSLREIPAFLVTLEITA